MLKRDAKDFLFWLAVVALIAAFLIKHRSEYGF